VKSRDWCWGWGYACMRVRMYAHVYVRGVNRVEIVFRGYGVTV
jgi:hypothetical protein